MGGTQSSKPRHELSDPRVTGRPSVAATPLPEQFLAGLKALPDGEALFALFQLPGTQVYRENNTCWNFDAVGSPSAIFQPLTEDHLASFLKYWAANPLPKPHSLSVAGGRHSHYGQKDHAIVIDMQKFDATIIDAEKKTGKFGAGLRLRAFDKACKAHGLAVTAGTNPDTGIAGLTLGGGFGHLCRRHGLSVDNLVSLRVVLASGEVVTATPDNEHADLLWACRGGGGNFGVVVEFEFRLHPRGDVLSGATVFLTRMFNDIPSILSSWAEAGKKASNDISLMGVLPCSGPALVLQAAYLGDDLEGEGVRQLAPIRSIGKPMIDTIKRNPYCDGPKPGADLQASAEAEQAPGQYYESGVLLADLSPGAIAQLIRAQTVLAPNKESVMLLALLGGEIATPPRESSAVGWRSAPFILMILGRWSNQKNPEAYIAERTRVVQWVKNILRDMAPYSVASYNTLGDAALDAVKTKALKDGEAAASASSGPPVVSPVDQTDPAVPVAVLTVSGDGAAGGSGSSSSPPCSSAAVVPSSHDADDVPLVDEKAALAAGAKVVRTAVNFKTMANWSAEQFERLRNVKQRYDPNNVFTNCNNIQPTPK
jgi:FAD/FMN-containing dehydrogenase